MTCYHYSSNCKSNILKNKLSHSVHSFSISFAYRPRVETRYLLLATCNICYFIAPNLLNKVCRICFEITLTKTLPTILSRELVGCLFSKNTTSTCCENSLPFNMVNVVTSVIIINSIYLYYYYTYFYCIAFVGRCMNHCKTQNA